MSEITDTHEGYFVLDHIQVPYTVRQITHQMIEIKIGDGFCRVDVWLRNDGNFEVVSRSFKSIKDNTAEVGSEFLGNIRKDCNERNRIDCTCATVSNKHRPMGKLRHNRAE